MGRFNLWAKLAQYMSKNASGLENYAADIGLPTRKQLKKMRPKRYRRAFTMGFRGFPKSQTPLGSIPAPTIDEVRHLERKYNQRLGVRHGLIHFKSDWTIFNKDEAERRMEYVQIAEAERAQRVMAEALNYPEGEDNGLVTESNA